MSIGKSQIGGNTRRKTIGSKLKVEAFEHQISLEKTKIPSGQITSQSLGYFLDLQSLSINFNKAV